MKLNFTFEPVLHSEREIYTPWGNRFKKEYNRSAQARQGHTLIMGNPPSNWNDSFKNGVGPVWFKLGKRNVGFTNPGSVVMGLNKETAVRIQYVCDVYVDPEFRGRGLLKTCILHQREQGRSAVLIDEKKLNDNAEYYSSLGFKYFMDWPDQELIFISPEKLVDNDFWTGLA
jgi:GNAT superfamily N-acetyltransferase